MLGYRGTMLKRIPIMALVVTTVVQFQNGQEREEEVGSSGQEREEGGGSLIEKWQVEYGLIAIGVTVGVFCFGCCCKYCLKCILRNRRDDEENIVNREAPR